MRHNFEVGWMDGKRRKTEILLAISIKRALVSHDHTLSLSWTGRLVDPLPQDLRIRPTRNWRH
jgi:hypothetical protein